MISDPIYEVNQHPSFYEGLPHISVNKIGNPFTPYVYKISWTLADIHYIGSSYRAGCHPSQLFNRAIGKRGYYTSSKHVHRYINMFGDPDHITIVSVHTTADDATKTEHMLLESSNAAKATQYLNKTNGVYGRMPLCYGFCNVRDKRTGQVIHIHVSCYDSMIHERLNAGKITVVDTITGETLSISTELYHTNQDRYAHASVGLVYVTNRENNQQLVITSDEYVKTKDKYSRHMANIIVVTNNATGQSEAISVDEYYSNHEQYTTVSKGKLAVIEKSTGDKVFIDKNEYKANKHLYARFAKGKVSAKLVSTGESVMVDSTEFHSNRHLYTAHGKGKVPITKGKSPHVNDEGDLQYFIKGQAPDGYVTARRIYRMSDGVVKWDKESLIKDFPGQYYPTASWYDSQINELIQLPSVVGRSNPDRYHQCRSETYQKFKKSLSK